MLGSTMRNGRPSVWAGVKPPEGRQEMLRQEAQLETSEASLQARMAALRSELAYLERQPITLGGEARIRRIRQELMETGLRLADVFQEHIRLTPRVASQ
jgi:hypothetical protein